MVRHSEHPSATRSQNGNAKSVAIVGTRGYPSYYGGFETAVRRLAPFLAERGWEVSVYGRPGATRASDPDLDPRVRSVSTRGVESKSLSTLSYGLTASIDVARSRPDVALVMNVANGYYLPMLKRRGIPTLVNVDGIEWDRAKWGRLAKGVFRTGARLTARYADELIFDSHAIERRWDVEFGRDGHFIPYGGDPAQQLPPEPGLASGSYVLLVARFVPENTVPEFIDAARTIAMRHPVVLVGSTGYGGDLDDRVRELAAETPNVHALGHISNDTRLHSLWQHAGVYFHGHSVGGTNPTLVQAMALGVPVVARDTIYNREVLQDAGVFVEPIAANIAKQVLALMDDSARRAAMARAAIERSTEHYTWANVCRQYEAALEGLIAPPARRRSDALVTKSTV